MSEEKKKKKLPSWYLKKNMILYCYLFTSYAINKKAIQFWIKELSELFFYVFEMVHSSCICDSDFHVSSEKSTRSKMYFEYHSS